MNKRLQQFITAENISQSQFADNIGVARASVSHIIAGRNKPGFDFVEKMARAFPALNIEWLITGHGKMYKTALGETIKPIVNEPAKVEDDLFGSSWEDAFSAPTAAESAPTMPEAAHAKIHEDSPTIVAKRASAIKSETSETTTQHTAHQRSITKIIVFYDDNSFQELR